MNMRWLQLCLAGLVLASIARAEAQSGDLKIIVLDGEDGVNIIDKKTAVKPIVEVRDKNDLPVAGALVVFSIIEARRGDSAVFDGGTKQVTVSTGNNGQAPVSAL